MARAAVLGGGSWGTTLAWLLGEKGVSVRLWFRDADQSREVETRRENARYLPGVRVPKTVACASGVEHSVAGAELVIVAVPSGAVVGTLAGCRDALAAGT